MFYWFLVYRALRLITIHPEDEYFSPGECQKIHLFYIKMYFKSFFEFWIHCALFLIILSFVTSVHSLADIAINRS